MFRQRIKLFLAIISLMPLWAYGAKNPQKDVLPSKDNMHILKCFSMSGPKGWSCIEDKSQLPGKIELIFVGSGKGSFTPSINVAMEETKMTLSEYVNLAQEYHLSKKESKGETKCTPLGRIRTQSGEAEVLQIDRETEWGVVRFLQASLIQDGKAYVMTATCLVEEFSNLCPLFFQAIRSFLVRPKTAGVSR